MEVSNTPISRDMRMISTLSMPIKGHSKEMVAAACSQKGLDSILLGAKVLAFTALDLIREPETLKKIKEEHKYEVEHQAD